ncbi:MAG TPA: hypothetical protein VJ817_08745 [Gemmatimonadales bacterium]|nr:hypothetical protein [Gemmatimonadales bacterium]
MTPRGLARIIAVLGAVLPAGQRRWAEALCAEIYAAETPSERLAMALSGGMGLIRIAVERVLAGWFSRPAVLGGAMLIGAAIGVMDISVPTRWPLRVTVVVSCLAMGMARPASAGLSGAIIGLGIAAVALLDRAPNPYTHDRGDVWIPLIPAVALTILGAGLANAWTRHRETRGSGGG